VLLPLLLLAAVIVTWALPERFESAADTAVIVTSAGDGTCAGAVYTPALEIVPTVESPPAVPLTCQLTAVFEVLRTDALNDRVAPTATVAVLGLTLTTTLATVTAAEALRVGSAAATALTVTVGGDGMFAGAV